MPHRLPRFLSLRSTMLAALGMTCVFLHAASPPADPADDELKQKAYATVSPDEEKGFTRKGAPSPGEWLHSVHEAPQPFELYRARTHIRPTAERRTIVLLPLGSMNDEQKKLLEDLREYAEAFFQLPARIEKPVELKLDQPAARGKELTRKVQMPMRRGANETP